ncbi:MAG: hypothetical protein JNG84_05725 [Archangium sp.]|nr:hypothetical protein [Archangium sp.]
MSQAYELYRAQLVAGVAAVSPVLFLVGARTMVTAPMVLLCAGMASAGVVVATLLQHRIRRKQGAF